ncbi:MAG: fatty acyl-AMP ligase [Anaerolineales bacterium]|nr:fatty acyl-AMP ligase [Anaerolineales bacterium]
MAHSSKQISNLVDIIQQKSATHPDQVAFDFVVDGESQVESLSYFELERRSLAIAARLQVLRAEGERAILLFPPGFDFIAAFTGCLFAGTIAVPTYPPDISRLERSLPRFMAIVRSAKPAVVLTTTPILALSQFILAQYPDLQRIPWLAVDQLIQDQPAADAWKHPGITPETLAFLQYTSGSTSEPKGVMISHSNLSWQIETIRKAFRLDPDHDRCVIWLPFYHDMGLIGGILTPLYMGVAITLFSPLDFLQRPARWLNLLSRNKTTVSGGPNFAYELCIRKATPELIQSLDLSSWKIAFNGAEPVRAETLERFAQVFQPCGFNIKSFYPCYGLAEATLLVSGVDRGHGPSILHVQSEALGQRLVHPVEENQPGSQRLVGAGHAWNNHQVAIVDPETGQACQPDQNGLTKVGEIWVSGPSIAQGYWERPEASQDTFAARLPGSPEQYLRTGDLGFLHWDELYVTGRIKDLIIVDGLNRYPQDLELTTDKCHPGLRPGCSAAFSVEITGQEQVVVVAEVARGNQLAQIAAQGDVEVSSEAISRSIRRAIAAEHDVHVFDVVLLKPGSVPKTSSGKIQRQACKQGYLRGTLDRWSPA